MGKITVITLEEALSLYTTKYQLAKALGLTPGAVYQRQEGDIPENWYLKLKYELKPAEVAEIEAKKGVK